MGRSRALLFVLLGLVMLVASSRCQLFFGDYTLPDASVDGTSDAIDPCKVVGYPEPPAIDPGGSDNDWTFALASIDYGLSDGGVRAFNLDQTCTCPGPDSCQRSETKCDEENGGDNAARTLFKTLENFVIKQSELNKLLKDGVSGGLIRVQRYNGQKDDNSVTVSIYPAIGLENDGGTKGDGTDRWWIERNSLKASTPDFPATQSTDKAWVVDGVLVASFQNALIVVGGAEPDGGRRQPPIRVSFAQAIITAKISDKGLASGRLAGRWPVDVTVNGNPSLLKSIEGFPDPVSAGYLCGDSSTFDFVSRTVCPLRDISAVVNVSGKCDAMSGVIGFTAVRAQIYDAGDGIDGGQPCGTSWDPKCPP